MIGFRPLRRSDFPALSRWLAAPHVARWWADPHDPDSLETEYGPCVDGTDPTEVFVAFDEDGDFGLIQRYAYRDEPEYVEELTEIVSVSDDDWSIDYFIGDLDRTGGGLGTAMIRAFVDRLYADHPAAGRLVVPVHADNERSWRALMRVGFTLTARGELEPDNPADSRDHVVMEYRTGDEPVSPPTPSSRAVRHGAAPRVSPRRTGPGC